MTAERLVGAPKPPDPAGIRTVEDVADYLRRLRAWAGQVSYPELVRRINSQRRPRDRARQTTVYDCFRSGRKRLDTELVLDIATALGLGEPGRTALRQAVEVAHSTAERPGAAAAAVPRQLPAPPQMFTGRVHELAELDRAPDTSTVVVTAIDGMAGIGKTALALHAARQIADRYPDGQLFLDLHGYTQGIAAVEPEEALDRLLRALGVSGPQVPGSLDERAALYRTRLADRRMLIVLDNAVAETQVAPLLPGNPGCLVLVTSRRRLTGLDHTRTLSLDTLPIPDAISLFRRTAGEGRLADEPPEPLAELVALCGRLPLAIRIAAARLRSHPAWHLSDLVERLRDQRHRLGELASGQRSVTAALDLSHQQLSPDQRRAYWLLGLHPGPEFDPYTTAALLDTTPRRARRLLDHLMEAHLLQEPATDRFRFHDLTRAHAAAGNQTARTTSDSDAALARMLDYYRYTASTTMDAAYPYEREHRPRVPPAHPSRPELSDPATALDWLDTELPNLLAAARYAAENGRHAHLLHLSTILHRHLRIRGRFHDADALHQQALATATAAGDQAGQVTALNGLGDIHWRQGRSGKAADHYRRALRIAQETGNHPAEVNTRNGLGYLHRMQGRYQQAADHLEEALKIARATGHHPAELDALAGLGQVHRLQDRYEQAADHFAQALRIARDTGNHPAELDALAGLGDSHRMQGRYRRAADDYEQVLEIARATGHRPGELNALNGLGYLYSMQGRHERAANHLGQSLQIARDIGHLPGELAALVGLGQVHRRRGRHAQAGDHLQRLLELARSSGDRNYEFEARQGLGRLRHATGDLAAAVAYHEQALTLAGELSQPVDQARAHDRLAHAYRALAQHEWARAHWRHALSLLTDLGVDETEDEDTTTTTIRAHLAKLPS